MPKHLFCAHCGLELLIVRKAAKSVIYDCVQPHNCAQLNDPVPGTEFVPLPAPEKKKTELDSLFDSFQFVKKINELGAKTGDNRPSETLRKEKEVEVKSSAPSNLFTQLGLEK